MIPLGTILFATDLRSTSEDVADVVTRVAVASGAHVVLLHVIEPIPRLIPTPSAVLAEISGAMNVELPFGSHEVTEGL